MPLFQPTNITPSSFAGIGGGTVDANDNIVISWQVNGNTPMVGFSIEIQSNDAASTVIGTINKLAVPDPSGGINYYSIAYFSGIDERGNPLTYTFGDSATWSSLGLQNGNSYKMLITQQYAEGENLIELAQYSPSVFITRSKPSLSLSQIPNEINSIQYTFGANYSQAQGDAINWCRWVLATNDNGIRTVIQDTGEIYTFNLSYSYNGFLNGQSYSVMCIVETQNGVQATTDWVDFNVSYTTASQGKLTVTCGGDSSASISLRSATNITGAISSGGEVSVNEEELLISNGTYITWSNINGTIGALEYRGDATGFRKAFSSANIGNVYAQEIVYSNGIPSLLIVACGTDTIYLNTYKINIDSNNQTSFSFLTSVETEMDLSTLKECSISVSGNRLFFNDHYDIYSATINNTTGDITNITEFNSSRYNDATIYYTKFVSNNFIVGSSLGTDIYSSSDFSSPSTALEKKSTCISVVNNYVFLGLYDPDYIACAFHINTPSNVSSFSPNAEASGGYYQCSNIAAQTYDTYNMLIVGGVYIDRFSTPAVQPTLSTYSFSYTSASNAFSFSQKNDLTMLSDIKPGQNPNSWSFGNAIGKLFSSGEAIFAVDYENYNLRKMYKLPEVYRMGSFNAYIGNPSMFYSIATGNDGIYEGYILGGNGLYCYDINDSNNNIIQFTLSNNRLLNVVRNPTTITVDGIEYDINGDEMFISLSPNDNLITWINNDVRGSTTINRSSYFDTSLTLSRIQLSGYQKCEYIGSSNQSPSNYNLRYEQSLTPNHETHYFYTTFDSPNSLYVLFPVNGILYRNENGILKVVGNLTNAGNVSINAKDYSIKSNQTVSYAFVYVQNDTYSGYTESEPFCQTFNGYYLLETEEDSEINGQYNVVKVWKFGNNISAGSVSNNNTPTWLTNFTPYRLRQLTSRSGKSGTLQALLSNVSNSAYADTAGQMEELYALSKTQNTLFLKDMKGNLYMVAVSAPIVQTINTKTAVQEVTVSIPWEEVGDASDVSIIGYGEETGS